MKKYKRTIILIMIESILAFAGVGIAMPIMTVFWNSIGLNQTMIGLSQAICSGMIILLEIPMGYIADKSNRKLMNLIGDFGLFLTFIIYMNAKNFIGVLISETICGIFVAITSGVDNSFLKFYSNKIDETGELFKKNNTILSILQSVGFVLAIFIGMVISKFSIKLCVGAMAIPYLLGFIISFFVKDIGDKIESNESNQIKNFKKDLQILLKNKETKWYMISFAVLDNIAHPIIWVLTPLLISVGVPVYIVGIAWILNYVGPIFGSIIAKNLQNKKNSTKFLVPYLIMLIGTVPIVISANIFTVWLFALTGFASGFAKVLFLPLVQNSVEDKYQTTIVSMTSTFKRLLYLPIVSIINLFGNDKPQISILADIIIFIPFALIILYYFKKEEVQKGV